MDYKFEIIKEIEDLASRMDTHLNNGAQYAFSWGEIDFVINDDLLVITSNFIEGAFTFASGRAAAEFVIMNAIPMIQIQKRA